MWQYKDWIVASNLNISQRRFEEWSFADQHFFASWLWRRPSPVWQNGQPRRKQENWKTFESRPNFANTFSGAVQNFSLTFSVKSRIPGNRNPLWNRPLWGRAADLRKFVTDFVKKATVERSATAQRACRLPWSPLRRQHSRKLQQKFPAKIQILRQNFRLLRHKNYNFKVFHENDLFMFCKYLKTLMILNNNFDRLKIKLWLCFQLKNLFH